MKNVIMTYLLTKIMVIVIFLLTVTMVHAGNLAYEQSQTFTFQLKNVSIKTVLQTIEKQSEFVFMYRLDLFETSKKVSVNVDKQCVSQILDQILEGTAVTYEINNRQIVLKKDEKRLESPQQTDKNRILGKVVDLDGNPIIGATVKEVNTSNGAITDLDGNFILKSFTGQSIEVSYVGYKSQLLKVKANEVLTIVMREDAEILDEVVVVGYGTQRKATLTGSVANIDGKTLSKSAEPNLVNSLAGHIPGLIINTRSSEPGSEVIEMNIRGKSTWKGGGPLVIIDGIANRDGLEKLNSRDIESISVLKDASAAIYGSRAANGVILVTTKRGKIGKPQFNYNGSVSLTCPVRVADMIHSWESAIYQNEIQEYKGSQPIYTIDQIEMFKNGTNKDLYPDYLVKDLVLQNFAPQTQHTFSVNGGNERVNFYTSFRYLYQDTYYKSNVDDYSSFNLRSNIDAKLHDNIQLKVDISGRKEQLDKALTTENLFQTILAAVPTEPFYYQNGLPGSVGKHNVLEEMKGKGGVRDERVHSINTLASLNWDLPFITKGLSVNITGAFDFSNVDRKDFRNTYDYYVLNSETGEYVNQNTNPKEGRTLTDYASNTYKYTFIGKIAYNRTFGKHAINSFIAYEQYSMFNRWFDASRSNFLSEKLPYLFAGDAELQKNNGGASETAYRNFFGKIGYSWADRYMFDFTLRRDQSVKFSSNERTGYFPGVSLGWRISEEDFFKEKFAFVDNLKLRASYGRMGSDNVSDFQYLSTAALRDGSSSLAFGVDPKVVPTLYITGVSNPYITWEVADTYNVGVDFSLSGGLFGMEFDYFHSKRSNILTSRSTSIPFYTGMTLPDENIGIAKNQGFDMLLRHQNSFDNGFKYALAGNLTYTQNKIVYMDEAKNVKDWQRKEGHPIDSYLLFRTDGLFNTQEEIDSYPHLANTKPGDIKYIDYNNDGLISNDDMVREYKSSMPKIVYGLNCNVAYKGFDLNLFLQGQACASVYINPTASGIDINVPRWLYENRWTPKTPNNEMPRAFSFRSETNNTRPSDFWLRKANFLRLKNVELAYTLPTKWIKWLGLENVRLYISGSNLLTFDNIKDYDPEVVNSLGIFYPATSMYNFGVDVTF